MEQESIFEYRERNLGRKLAKSREMISISVGVNFGIALIALLGLVAFHTQSPTLNQCGDSLELPTCECTNLYKLFGYGYLAYVVSLFAFCTVIGYHLYHAFSTPTR